MIPARAELRRAPPVHATIPRRKGTLRQTRHAILKSRQPLPHTMPMDPGPVIPQLIIHLHNDLIAPIRINGGTHILPIDQERRTPLHAIRGCSAVRDGQVVGADVAGRWPLSVEVGGDAEAVGPAGARLGRVLAVFHGDAAAGLVALGTEAGRDDGGIFGGGEVAGYGGEGEEERGQEAAQRGGHCDGDRNERCPRRCRKKTSEM